MKHSDFMAAAVLLSVLCAAPALASPLAARALAELPMRFEPNVGQAPAAALFVARLTGGDDALLVQRHAAISLVTRADSAAGFPAMRALRLSLAHARMNPELVAEKRQSSVSNYFVGSDPGRWRSRVANFAAVRYQQVYPGIDWVLYGNPQRLEYDFVIAPHASARRIRVNVQGADHLAVAEDGALLINAGKRTLRQLPPSIYQTAADGTRRAVTGRYVVAGRQFSFALGPYDHSRALTIDPAFVYSTYLGGSGGTGNDDGANAIAVDSAGDAYVAGVTSSSNFPTAVPVQPTNHGRTAFRNNAFVLKLKSDGSGLLWSTYLGGSDDKSFDGDGATGIAVDADGNAYVTGYTGSSNFPTQNALQSINKSTVQFGATQAFVAKLSADGSTLLYSTYLGGSGADSGTAIAVDAAGDAYVGGTTSSTDFPVAAPLQATNRAAGAGASTGFVSKLDPSGSALVYSTYLGGSGAKSFNGGDVVNAIAVDSSGYAYVAGTTASTDFPLAGAFQAVNRASYNAFVAKLSSSGRSLVYSTYLGGSNPIGNCVGCGSTWGSAIAVDAAGEVVVAGSTDAVDFPTVNPLQAVNRATGGSSTAFVSKFSAAGNALLFSTYLGGSGGSGATAVALDNGANAYVAGYTTSEDFPLESSLQSTNRAAAHGATNAFVSVLAADGGELAMSTYLGGSGRPSLVQPACGTCPLIYNGDGATGVAVDGAGNVYVAGTAYSSDFPTVNALQAANRSYAAGGSNGFVARLNSLDAPSAGGNGLLAASGGGALGWESLALLVLALLARALSESWRRARLH
jgi:hypothetical protein